MIFQTGLQTAITIMVVVINFASKQHMEPNAHVAVVTSFYQTDMDINVLTLMSVTYKMFAVRFV